MDENDTVSDVLCFYHNFTKREILKSLFLKAITNARKFMTKSDLQSQLEKEKRVEATRMRLYFQGLVLKPCRKKPFNEIVSGNCGAKVPVDAMIIAKQ